MADEQDRLFHLESWKSIVARCAAAGITSAQGEIKYIPPRPNGEYGVIKIPSGTTTRDILIFREDLDVCPTVENHSEVVNYCLLPLASENLSDAIQQELAQLSGNTPAVAS
jgi:hypothetical protein